MRSKHTVAGAGRSMKCREFRSNHVGFIDDLLPAALVYRRVEGSSQVVDLYVCGNPRPVRSTTLSVP